MTEPRHLLHTPPGPSVPKRFLDQQVIPLLIDAAGIVETVLQHVATRVRQAPGQSLGIALGTGMLVAILRNRRRA